MSTKEQKGVERKARQLGGFFINGRVVREAWVGKWLVICFSKLGIEEDARDMVISRHVGRGEASKCFRAPSQTFPRKETSSSQSPELIKHWVKFAVRW